MRNKQNFLDIALNFDKHEIWSQSDCCFAAFSAEIERWRSHVSQEEARSSGFLGVYICQKSCLDLFRFVLLHRVSNALCLCTVEMLRVDVMANHCGSEHSPQLFHPFA